MSGRLHRILGRRRAKLLAALVVALVVAAGAGAYFTATGSGSGSGSVGSPADLTIAALTPAAGLLYPGGTGEVDLTISNPNTFPVRVNSLVLGTGGISADAGHSGCDTAALAFTTQTKRRRGLGRPRQGGRDRRHPRPPARGRDRHGHLGRERLPGRHLHRQPGDRPVILRRILSSSPRATGRRRRLLLVGAALLVAGLLAGGLIAYFSGAASAGSAGGAAAGTLPAGNTPTLALAGRDVTVTWDQTSFQGNPLGTVGHGGYVIARYAESAPGTPITPGAACDGTQTGAADPLSCTETGLSTGRWKYTVATAFWNWQTEGAQSAHVIVPPAAPASVSLVNGLGVGGAYVNAANAAGVDVDVTLPASSLSSDTVGLTVSDGTPAHDVTASTAAPAGAGTVSFTGLDLSGLDDGPLTIMAVATSSYGDGSGSTSITRTKDTVDPVVNVAAGRAADSNGWYNQPVTFSAGSSTDTGGSGIDTCDPDVSYTGPDTASGSLDFSCTDLAGNSASGSISFQYDATAPVVHATAGRPADQNGWYNHLVAFTALTSIDATSGIDTCDPTVNYSGPDTASGSLTFNCTDLAGNSASDSISFKYDSTNPVVSIDAGRSPDHNGWYNHAVTFSAGASTDATSGIDTCDANVDYTGPDTASGSLTFNCTDLAGNSASDSIGFKYDATDPSVSVSPDRSPDLNGWYNHAVTWTASGTDATSGIDTCQSSDYTGPDGTGLTATRSCTDNAGNSASADGATFKYDATDPSVSVSPDRSPDLNGWYNHAVTWTASGTDATSGIDTCQSSDYTGPDGTGLTATRSCTDNAGNSASADGATFKYDATDPSVSVSPDRSPDLNGWYNHAVTWTASGTDATSGIDTCQSSDYTGPDGTGLTATRSCTDNAGNSASADGATFKYDATKPSVTAVTFDRSPDLNGWYNHTVTWTVTGSDATSGISSCSAPSYGGPDGTGLSVDGTCTDQAGNTSSPHASATFKYDGTAPDASSIVRADASPTNAATVHWTVTFGESVTGVDAADFSLANTGLGGTPAATGVTGSGTTWTVTASTGTSGTGTLGLDLVDDDSILDAAGNKLGGTGTGNGNFTGQVYDVDLDGPSVTIDEASGQGDPTSSSPIDFTVVFSESTTDFATGDVTLGGTAGATTATVTGSGTTYNVAVSGMTSSGTVIASIAAGVAHDAVGNANTASTSTDNTVTYTAAPVALCIDAASACTGATANVKKGTTFSSTVSLIDSAGHSTTYSSDISVTVTWTGDASGSTTLTILAGHTTSSTPFNISLPSGNNKDINITVSHTGPPALTSATLHIHTTN